MTAQGRIFGGFEAAFAIAFEEEISGVTYFEALAQAEADPRCAAHWAKLAEVESCTVAALRPVAAALGLEPADEAAVRQSGRNEAGEWQALPWRQVMALILRDYPVYVTEFEQLAALAPPRWSKAAQLLIDHEKAIIDMARAELAGEADPGAPLDAYLAAACQWRAE